MKIRAMMGALAVLLLAAAFAGRTAYRSAQAAAAQLHPPRVPVSRPADVTDLQGLSDVTFTAGDGVALHGWYVPSRNRAAVVLCHGFSENRAQLLFEARHLSHAGYGVLLFDWRGHGESGGELVTWGDRERLDLSAALDFLSARPDVDPARLGAVGFSMGGAVVLLVAEADPRVRAVVASGTYPTLEDELRWNYRRWGPLSSSPAIWAMARGGVRVDDVRPVDALCALKPRPLLLIAGTLDPYAPMPQQERMLQTACAPKELWKVEGAGHGEYARVAAGEYTQRLLAHFERALLH